MSPAALRRFRAERLLRDEFERLRERVIGSVSARLRACGAELDASDLEACYAVAWQGLYATVLEGTEVANPVGWLVLVTYRRAIDEQRARRALACAEIDQQADGPAGIALAAGAAPGGRDLADELDDALDCASCSRRCADASARASAKRPRCATCRVSRAPRPQPVWA
jgi:DNA-directed RNA polymerase specialized sigma24 family protein